MSSLRRRIGVGYKHIQEHVRADLNAITADCRDSIIGGIAVTLLFHWLVDIFLRRFVSSSISEAMFQKASFAVAALSNPLVLLASALATFLAVYWRRVRWEDIDTGYASRSILYATLLTLTWSEAFYVTNSYYGHLHLFERLVVLTSPKTSTSVLIPRA